MFSKLGADRIESSRDPRLTLTRNGDDSDSEHENGQYRLQCHLRRDCHVGLLTQALRRVRLYKYVKTRADVADALQTTANIIL